MWIFFIGLPMVGLAEVVSDPLPEPQFINEIGIKLVPIAEIPNSPLNDLPPRINHFHEVPDGSGRFFTIDQRGYLYCIMPDGEVLLYMDVRDHIPHFHSPNNAFGQNGFTYFAFHPEFADNGLLYTVLSVTTASGTPDFLSKRPINPGHGADREPSFHDIIVEWQVEEPDAHNFSGDHRVLFRIEQPFLDHNTGELTFNPYAQPGDADYGMLYIAIADGGNNWPFLRADPGDNGQDPSTPLGTIFRIDPLGNNSANGRYGIPDDNPFVGSDGPELPEIWTYGHRNHHRLNWDNIPGYPLYSYEMGQAFIEEVNLIVPGGNYGWGIREGSFEIRDKNQNVLYALPENDAELGLTYPVAQYAHVDTSGAISGGFVYRGSEIPQLYGKMIFADFTANSRMMYTNTVDFEGLGYAESAPIHLIQVYDENDQPSTLSEIIRGTPGERTDVRFAMDLAGNLYLTNKHNNTIYRIHAPPNEPAITVDRQQLWIEGPGGTLHLNVETTESADWNILPYENWIKVTEGKNRIGSQQIRLQIEPLDSGQSQREGLLIIAGTQVTIIQEAREIPGDYFSDAEHIEAFDYEVPWWGSINVQHWPWLYDNERKWYRINTEFSTADSQIIYHHHQGWINIAPTRHPWIYHYETERWKHDVSEE